LRADNGRGWQGTSPHIDGDITPDILRKLFAVTGRSYSEKRIDYGTSPGNARTLEKHDGYGRISADDCGDVVEVWLRVRDASRLPVRNTNTVEAGSRHFSGSFRRQLVDLPDPIDYAG